MRRRDDVGMAMVTVVLLAAVLTGLGVLMVGTSLHELDASSKAVRSTGAFQAAEAGLDDYVAKLAEDHSYFFHYVHPAESTRRRTNGNLVAAGAVWPQDSTWTYPNGKDAWKALGNGFEYNLQVTAPAAGSTAVVVVATGRPTGAAKVPGVWRAVQAQVRPTSVADFQMIANADVSYGSTATTYGKLYAGIDSSGRKHDISHYGTAYGDLYAEGSITRAPTYRNGARGYDQTTIRKVVPNPVNFTAFTTALVDVQSAAQSGGLNLNDATKDGWRLIFDNTGHVSVAGCTRLGPDLGDRAPSCATATTYTVPTNGAIYAAQSVMVSGTLKGKVTVASNQNVYIVGDIAYNQTGVDVLGLIAKNDMVVAQWCPNDLTWTAATIAQNGAWHSYAGASNGSHGTMTFTGGTATNQGGYMTMFDTRVYAYDTNLEFLQPPYFPVLEEAYTVLFFREVNP